MHPQHWSFQCRISVHIVAPNHPAVQVVNRRPKSLKINRSGRRSNLFLLMQIEACVRALGCIRYMHVQTIHHVALAAMQPVVLLHESITPPVTRIGCVKPCYLGARLILARSPCSQLLYPAAAEDAHCQEQTCRFHHGYSPTSALAKL